MTTIKKELSRITDAVVFEKGKSREVIVSLLPGGTIGLRLKGTKRKLFVPVVKIFWYALRQEAMRLQLEKARERKERKHAKKNWRFN